MPLNLDERFARVPLAFFPSPIHKLERLSRELGVEVWAKRDDVSSGLAFGGNKVRKLEWLAAEALAQGCDTLVSIGNVQSNHTRQVAAVAAVLGLKCRLVQEEWTRWDDPAYGKVGNILLSRIMGAEIVLEGEGYSTAVKGTFERALEQVRREGGKPYAIPAGASDHPLGGLGYAHLADELARQEAELGLFFDTVVTATCTGSTQAGMVVGFLAQDRPRRLIGIDTAADAAMTRAAVTKIARATAELVGLRKEVRDEQVRVAASFVLAMSLGVALGILMGRVRLADELGQPWLVFFLNLPALVTIILCYIWIGLIESAAVLAVALNKIPNVVVTVREGARALDRGLLEMAEVFRVPMRRRLSEVVLPQLYPYLAAAARSGLALIWKIVLVVELLGRSNGVGFQLGVFFQLFDVAGILAYALSFITVVQLIEWTVLQPLERRVNRWRR